MVERMGYEEIPVGSAPEDSAPIEIQPSVSGASLDSSGWQFNGNYIDDSELSKKFEELKLRTDHMEKGRNKVLALAFGAGALSLGALATVVHVMRK